MSCSAAAAARLYHGASRRRRRLLASSICFVELLLVLRVHFELCGAPLLGKLQSFGHGHLVHACQFADQLGVTRHH